MHHYIGLLILATEGASEFFFQSVFRYLICLLRLRYYDVMIIRSESIYTLADVFAEAIHVIAHGLLVVGVEVEDHTISIKLEYALDVEAVCHSLQMHK